MDIYNGRLRLNSEHKEFARDITNVIISYTPVSGIIDTIRFGSKWFHKRKMHSRVSNYLKERERRNHRKAKSRKIRDSYRRIGVI